jgi:hypothetical protein
MEVGDLMQDSHKIAQMLQEERYADFKLID